MWKIIYERTHFKRVMNSKQFKEFIRKYNYDVITKSRKKYDDRKVRYVIVKIEK